jgi:DNA polymerase-3 subunit beta
VAFADALKRVALLSSERNRAVKISVAKGKVEVSAKNPEVGEAREALSAGYSGSEVEIGFNARYILDFLGVVEADTVCMELKDEATQGLLRRKESPKEEAPKGDKQPKKEKKAAAAEEYQYVVMPMRI